MQLETGRLLLRPWRISEAVVLHELWTERDPRVPPHRRIDADGHPTVTDLEDWIRTNQPSSIGLLAVERKVDRDVIGYCGLIDSGRGSDGEPELAFELLRRVWRQGYATEASLAVLDWARSSGYERLWATVWEWNTASRRVLAKVGFTETSGRSWTRSTGTTCSPRDGSDSMLAQSERRPRCPRSPSSRLAASSDSARRRCSTLRTRRHVRRRLGSSAASVAARRIRRS